MDSPDGPGGNAGGVVHERTEQEDLEHAPSARVTLEVRILDATLRSRQLTPEHTPVAAPSGPGSLVVVFAADRDLGSYVHSHLSEVKAWRVVAAESPAHALRLLQSPSEVGVRPVLVLDGTSSSLLALIPPPLSAALRIVLLADAFPPEFMVRDTLHALLPWPLDVPTVVQRVTQLVSMP